MSLGQDYMIGASEMGRFFIQAVSGDGKVLGAETTTIGSFDPVCTAAATFRINGSNYVLLYSNSDKSYRIFELLHGGKLGQETDSGNFSDEYSAMHSIEMLGQMHLIANGKSALSFWKLLGGGKLGDKTFSKSPDFDQFLPFTQEGQDYAFTFNTSNRKWTIVEISGKGLSTVTDSGQWQYSYTHVVMWCDGNIIIFGLNQDSKLMFVQPIKSGGILGSQFQNGWWDSPYASLSWYSHGAYTFLFGQDTREGGSMDMFLKQVDVYDVAGKITPEVGKETYSANWKHSYQTVVFYKEYE